MVLKFEKAVEEDFSDGEWLAKNSKECPKCFSSIEKNGGCNHMTCSRCGFYFCWVCSVSLRQHERCKPNETKISLPKNDQKRLFDCASKRSVMLQSIALDAKNYKKKIDEQEKEAAKNSFYCIDFVKEAIETLMHCRYTSANSFIFKYFCFKMHNLQWLRFEMTFNSFLKVVEELSEVLETPVNNENIHEMIKKIDVNVKQCKNWHKAVYELVHEGYEQNYWTK
jgi:ariadne-1